jgi:hypothetical protein
LLPPPHEEKSAAAATAATNADIVLIFISFILYNNYGCEVTKNIKKTHNTIP